jgi:hypothetical protein
MKAIMFCLAILHITVAQLCAQEDSLNQILDDIQDDEIAVNSWLEILSDQILMREKSTQNNYPKISFIHRLQYTLEQNKGLAKNVYLGSPFESYSKLRLSLYKNVSAGMLIQKDVGELSFSDHYSGYISWRHPVKDVKIVLGNFFIRAGDGLLLSAPFSLPKISLIKTPSSKRLNQIRPFLSSNEYDGFLGGAIELGNSGGWKLIAFYSQILRDAILSDNKSEVSGFERTGYHRTYSERNRANRLLERSIGGTIRFPFFFIDHLGISYVKTEYTPGIVARPSITEKRRAFYKFYGNQSENYSLFYTKNFSALRLSGEIVPLKSKRIAHITTLNIHPTDWQVVLKSWYIPSQFHTPFGRIPTDSNPFPKSVKGFMFGIIGNPVNHIKTTSFWISKKDLWRTYFQPLPVQKKEFYFQSEIKIGQKKSLYFRYHLTTSHSYPSVINGRLKLEKHKFRFQLKQSLNANIRFRTRLEKVFLRYSSFYSSSSGINFYQDLYWQIVGSIELRLRFSSFSSDDYDSRIYEYENDLPYVFSNFALYGRGRKWYVMLTANPVSPIKIWLKFRRIIFDDVESIGSGLMKIDSDMRQDIHFQIEYRY